MFHHVKILSSEKSLSQREREGVRTLLVACVCCWERVDLSYEEVSSGYGISMLCVCVVGEDEREKDCKLF